MQCEMRQLQQEKELTQRELEFARQQIEILQGTQNLIASTSETETFTQTASAQQETCPVNISTVADLLTTVHRLIDDMTKILNGSRLRGKAHEWFHSRSEYLAMSISDLLQSLGNMFRLEARVWKREESFTDYMHEKISLGNLVPIRDAEIVEYLIEGIPDAELKGLARVKRIQTKTDLLQSFQGISLQEKSLPAAVSSRDKDSRMQLSDVEKARAKKKIASEESEVGEEKEKEEEEKKTAKQNSAEEPNPNHGVEDWGKNRKTQRGDGTFRKSYTYLISLYPKLVAVVGTEQMVRHTVVKKIRSIVKERELYDSKNKQFAICDDELLTVFGVKRFRTFGMMKYLVKHFKV